MTHTCNLELTLSFTSCVRVSSRTVPIGWTPGLFGSCIILTKFGRSLFKSWYSFSVLSKCSKSLSYNQPKTKESRTAWSVERFWTWFLNKEQHQHRMILQFLEAFRIPDFWPIHMCRLCIHLHVLLNCTDILYCKCPKNDVINLVINWDASFRWSFGPLSAWGSIESMTILTTHPSLKKWRLN